MNISRRRFIKNSSLTLAGLSFIPSALTNKVPADILGVQLYSVRDDMKTDPAGTLKKLAQMGYKYVEHAGYQNGKFYENSILDFKKILIKKILTLTTVNGFLEQ